MFLGTINITNEFLQACLLAGTVSVTSLRYSAIHSTFM